MRSLKTIQLILTFYRSFLITSFFLTALCIGMFWKYGIIAFTGIFWFKICTLFLIYYFISGFKAKEFLYYQNLGISKRLLWVVTLSFDCIIFLLSMILTYKIR